MMNLLTNFIVGTLIAIVLAVFIKFVGAPLFWWAIS